MDATDGGGGIPVTKAADCGYECYRRANCFFWSYVADWRVNCFLKAEAGEERKMENAVTGWKADGCAPPSLVPTTTTTIRPSTTPRVSSLRRRLQRPKKQSNAPVVSTGGLLDNSGCRLEDTALLGGDLPRDLNGDGFRVSSFVECRLACRNQRACNAFTYVSIWEDRNCFLKERKIEESEFVGATSGTLQPCAASLFGGSGGKSNKYATFKNDIIVFKFRLDFNNNPKYKDCLNHPDSRPKEIHLRLKNPSSNFQAEPYQL